MPDKICPFGVFEDVSFKNKDPGEIRFASLGRNTIF